MTIKIADNLPLPQNVSFYLDGKNSASWIGKPTVNYYEFPDAAWNGSNFVLSHFVDTTGAPTHTVTYVPGVPNPVGAAGVMRYYTGANQTYKYIAINSLAVPTTQNYNMTYYARIISGPTASTNFGNIQLWRNSGAGDQGVTGDWNPTYTREWQKFSVYGSVAAGNQLQFFLMHYTLAGYTVEWCGFQLEAGTFGTTWWNGTRTNTQAFRDLSNRQIITANSATYNTNNTYSFNGSSDYLSSGQLVGPGASQYAVSIWYRRTRNNVGNEQLVSQWTNANLGNSFYVGFSGNSVRFTDNWSSITVAGAANLNVWQNLTFVNTGSNAFVYLNGQLAATYGSRFTYTGVGNSTIGRQGETTEYFGGDIDKVIVYNTSLTATEVAQIFNATRGRYGV
jgi:hypothetical protein